MCYLWVKNGGLVLNNKAYKVPVQPRIAQGAAGFIPVAAQPARHAQGYWSGFDASCLWKGQSRLRTRAEKSNMTGGGGIKTRYMRKCGIDTHLPPRDLGKCDGGEGTAGEWFDGLVTLPGASLLRYTYRLECPSEGGTYVPPPDQSRWCPTVPLQGSWGRGICGKFVRSGRTWVQVVC